MVFTDRILSDGFFFACCCTAEYLIWCNLPPSCCKKMSSREKRLFVHIKVSKAVHTLQTNAIKQDKMVYQDAILNGFLDRIFIA